VSEAVRSLITRLAEGEPRTPDETRAAFEAILSGETDPALIGAFLLGLRIRGETVEDIVAGARTLRTHMKQVPAPEEVVDTCGTGGLGWVSLNTSTAAAFIAAGAGAVIAKHGNRSVSPKVGSADVLEALGVNLNANEAQTAACFAKARLAFLFAPAHHSAMRHVAPVRRLLGVRTIFNLLGPLSNPAGARRQVLGVFDAGWVIPYAEALRELGAKRAFVVHGADGMDELTTTGPSHVAEIRDGRIRTYTTEPETLGLRRASPEALRGRDTAFNADAVRRVLCGEQGPFSDLAALNAAAALIAAERAENLKDGIALAQAAIRSGAALECLERVKAGSHA